MYTFIPSGVCAKQINFSVVDGKIEDLHFVGGCDGSLSAITRLLEGQELTTVIETLKGVTCGKKNTSCPDQLTQALQNILDGNEADLKASAPKPFSPF